MEGGVAVGVQLDAPAFLIERDLNPLQHPVSDDFSLEEKERLACADQLGERLAPERSSRCGLDCEHR